MTVRETDLRTLTTRLGDVDEGSLTRLLPVVYDELRSLSAAYLRREPAGLTLQATALVNEAYVRLAASPARSYAGRRHFLRVAAATMRRILVDHARERRSLKRGAGQRGVTLQESALLARERDVDLVALDELLAKLERLDPQKAKVVELRFFGGCSIDETAESLGIASATVERHWRFARAWLRDRLTDPSMN